MTCKTCNTTHTDIRHEMIVQAAMRLVSGSGYLEINDWAIVTARVALGSIPEQVAELQGAAEPVGTPDPTEVSVPAQRAQDTADA